MVTTRKLRFTEAYRETTALRDGRPVMFRLLRPSDKAALVHGLQRMSPESRYRRFFTLRDSLSPDELAYLTEIDQFSHFALAAGFPAADGKDLKIGLGVGRFVCDPDAPHRAEAAVAVVDDVQGQGLGKMLFERLVGAARERGVTEFYLDILPENLAMLGLLRNIFPETHTYPDSDVVCVTCPMPPERPPERAPEFPFYRVLALAAAGALRVMRAARSWPIPDDLVRGMLTDASKRPPRIVEDERE